MKVSAQRRSNDGLVLLLLLQWRVSCRDGQIGSLARRSVLSLHLLTAIPSSTDAISSHLRLTCVHHINSLQRRGNYSATVPHRMIWSWYTGRWWVGCYIWYSEEGTGRGRSPPRPLIAVPNVTAHPPTASASITVLLYNGLLLCGFNAFCPLLSVSCCFCGFTDFSGYCLRHPSYWFTMQYSEMLRKQCHGCAYDNWFLAHFWCTHLSQNVHHHSFIHIQWQARSLIHKLYACILQ